MITLFYWDFTTWKWEVKVIDRGKALSEISFPFHWMAKLYFKWVSRKYPHLEAKDESLDSKRFWDKFNNNLDFRVKHLSRMGLDKGEAYRLAIENGKDRSGA
jgi:hypothetical protein